ncbi:MAG: PKD domain-containing protein [Bacteroidetes bacterium]|nr:MAG: PKD domain-containing protein [Bacteroidota bacterium]REK00747.1 MAG: PKD domain-containing protein [Bacteroidota bacterium]REK34995.1 MAG: PKD domain-containing protein [Bacteroidota bacterium]REK48207.1 MAG: PKD domain-containing protein [Bacteroidota bacterium]
MAQAGKDGAKSIPSGTSFVNEYTGISSDVNSGTNTIQVVSNNLNSGGLFSSALGRGDLIMIIQMQGVQVSNPDDSTYGAITNYNNCGRYEFAEVSSVSGSNNITTSCALQNSYSVAGRTQVLRVPRFSSLTINSGGILTCPPWNGATGGVLAVETSGNISIGSGATIDVSAKGFRGGALLENVAWWGVVNYFSNLPDYGAEKGEGIFGYQSDYDILGGRYGKGAAANGGGGGNAHNAGGGGGGNGGSIPTWTGRGNPDISNASWIPAWNLEYPGFATSTSSGGGRGGYSFSSSNQNAIIAGPGNSVWGGDIRRENGGMGGRPLDYSGNRIFLGGGGGAGDQNDNLGGIGGRGGGIAYVLCYGNLSGSGQILANGSNGGSSNGKDGSGGGGAGGTIIINCNGNISGISAVANGGNGGSQTLGPFITEAEGPGGGGGGGHIAVSNGGFTRTANGGVNGVTNSYGLTEFPPNGATRGGAGEANASIQNFSILVASPVNACSGSSVTINASVIGTLPSGSILEWYDSPIGGNLLGSGNTYTSPALSATTTYYVGTCPGIHRIPVQVNVSSVQSVFSANTPVCLGESISFQSASSSSLASIINWSWNTGDGSGTLTGQTASYTYLTAGTWSVVHTVTDSYGCTSSSSQNVTVNPSPQISFNASPRAGCAPFTVSFSNSTPGLPTYSWNFGDNSPSSSSPTPTHTYSNPGTYTVSLRASLGACSDSLRINNMITVYPRPLASFSVNPIACTGDSIQFVNSSSGGGGITGYTWNFGDGSPARSGTNPKHAYSSPGNYQVTLTCSTAQCTDDTVITVSVSPAPLASFSVSSANVCAGETITFINQTTGSATYTWNFGDGSPASSLNSPSHSYSSTGTYSVRLIAQTGSCSDTSYQQNLVTVSPSPLAGFTISSTCLGDSTIFNNQSQSNGSVISGYSWQFGDGSANSVQPNPKHLYSSPGNYFVTLIAYGSGSCSDTIIQSITINSRPTVNFVADQTQGCDSLTVNFSNQSTGAATYTWLFGDGQNSTLSSPTHHYSSAGNYTVVLTASSNNGCSSSKALFNHIIVRSSPTAIINSTSSVLCRNDCRSFSAAASAGSIYEWNFHGGNPASASVQNPAQVCYPDTGIYSVSLSVRDAWCSGFSMSTGMVRVVDCSSVPVASFISSDNIICSGDCIDFASLSTNATSWEWNFPGATPAQSFSEQPASICYPVAGLYPVSLKVANSMGLDSLTVQGAIEVNQNPVAPSISRSGDTLYSTPASSYQWYLNGIEISGANLNFYLASLAGTYTVRIGDINGCYSHSQPYSLILLSASSGLINEINCIVYPNPFTESPDLLIQTPLTTRIHYRLFDETGRIILADAFQVKPGFSIFNLNSGKLPGGIYILELNSPSGTFRKKLISR